MSCTVPYHKVLPGTQCHLQQQWIPLSTQGEGLHSLWQSWWRHQPWKMVSNKQTQEGCSELQWGWYSCRWFRRLSSKRLQTPWGVSQSNPPWIQPTSIQYQSQWIDVQFYFKTGPLQCRHDVSQCLMFYESLWIDFSHNVGHQYTLSSTFWPSWGLSQD